MASRQAISEETSRFMRGKKQNIGRVKSAVIIYVLANWVKLGLQPKSPRQRRSIAPIPGKKPYAALDLAVLTP